jgi:hypothetical protein
MDYIIKAMFPNSIVTAIAIGSVGGAILVNGAYYIYLKATKQI